MTIREQYKLAYRLLRDPDYGLWDHRTFKIICEINGIEHDARIRALISYNNSRAIDEIGEFYRAIIKSRKMIRMELEKGHY